MRWHLLTSRRYGLAAVLPISLLAVMWLLTFGHTIAHAQAIQISDTQALSAGKRLWRNECAGTVEGLTSWNTGEAFASLGIGHYIWYPAGQHGPLRGEFSRTRALPGSGERAPPGVAARGQGVSMGFAGGFFARS